jgi:hypothetical protein
MQVDRRALVLAGAAGAAGLAGGARAEGAAKALLGAWRLVDADTIYSDGRVTPWDDLPKPYQGLIVYLPQGLMTVQISAARKPRSPADPELTNEEKARYFETYYGYFGRFEVDEANAIVTHRIVSALRPDEIGLVYRRHFDLDGDNLTLKTVRDPNSRRDSYNRLVWRRQS